MGKVLVGTLFGMQEMANDMECCKTKSNVRDCLAQVF
jgi:hypothetical protein